MQEGGRGDVQAEGAPGQHSTEGQVGADWHLDLLPVTVWFGMWLRVRDVTGARGYRW